MEIPTVETLVYVLEAGPKLILIDAGWNDAVGWAALQDGFADLGLDMTSVAGVVVTHHHPDHSGLAGRVQQISDSWIAMHKADCDLLDEVAKIGEKHWEWEAVNLFTAGASQADVEAFLSQGSMVASTRPATPDRQLTDHQTITCENLSLAVFATPGHTPGHICVALADRRLLFSGDHVLSRTTPHIGLYNYPLGTKDPLGAYMVSLKRTRRFDGWMVLPAHEEPIEHLSARLSEIELHHHGRLDEVIAVLSKEPLSLWSVATALKWQGEWDHLPPLSRQLALAEAAAHVQYLLRSGCVSRVGGCPERFMSTGRNCPLEQRHGDPTNDRQSHHLGGN